MVVALVLEILKEVVELQVALVLEQAQVPLNQAVEHHQPLALVQVKELVLHQEGMVALLLALGQVQALEQDQYLDRKALLQEVVRVPEQAPVAQLVQEALPQAQGPDQVQVLVQYQEAMETLITRPIQSQSLVLEVAKITSLNILKAINNRANKTTNSYRTTAISVDSLMISSIYVLVLS